jgi:hypothetical protein
MILNVQEKHEKLGGGPKTGCLFGDCDIAKEVEAPESECSIYNFTKCNGFERGSSTQDQIPLLVWGNQFK